MAKFADVTMKRRRYAESDSDIEDFIVSDDDVSYETDEKNKKKKKKKIVVSDDERSENEQSIVISDSDNEIISKKKKITTNSSDDELSSSNNGSLTFDVRTPFNKKKERTTKHNVMHRTNDYDGVTEIKSDNVIVFNDVREINNDNKDFSIRYTDVKNIAESSTLYASLLSTEGANVIMRHILRNERYNTKKNQFLLFIQLGDLTEWVAKQRPNPPVKLIDKRGYFDLLCRDGATFLINVVLHCNDIDEDVPDIEELVRAYRFHRSKTRNRGQRHM